MKHCIEMWHDCYHQMSPLYHNTQYGYRACSSHNEPKHHISLRRERSHMFRQAKLFKTLHETRKDRQNVNGLSNCSLTRDNCTKRSFWANNLQRKTRNGSPKTGIICENPNVSMVRRIAWRMRTNSSNLDKKKEILTHKLDIAEWSQQQNCTIKKQMIVDCK